MNRYVIYFIVFLIGIAFGAASLFTEAKSEPVCVNAFPPYFVSLQTKCAIEALAGKRSIECGTFEAERHIHRQTIIDFYAEHGTYPEIGGISKKDE